MEFKTKGGNFIKSKNSTSKMMYHVILCLIPLLLFAFYKNGIVPLIKGFSTTNDMLKLIVILFMPAAIGMLTEYIWYFFAKDKRSFLSIFEESFAIIPGMFISLIIPLNTPIWLVALASVVASLSKLIFGGFGKNIFNPALVGGLIVIIFASSYVSSFGGYTNSYEVSTISGATPLANMAVNNYADSYEALVSPYGNLFDFLLGNRPGAIGETCIILCIIAFIYLLINKVIKWRITLFYILTVFLMTGFIGFNNNLGLWYPLFQLMTGSIVFGAVFMATDPVTSPITKTGQVIGGISLGILTMVFRYLTPFPEGVLLSILIVNMFTIIINKLSIKFNFKKIYKVLSIIFIVFIMCAVTFVINNNIKKNQNTDESFKILETKVLNNKKIYKVSAKGYSGNNSIKATITFENDKISKIEITNTHETYFKMIEDNNYINELIDNQDNLENVDTISGATYTSDYLKEIINKAKVYNNK